MKKLMAAGLLTLLPSMVLANGVSDITQGAGNLYRRLSQALDRQLDEWGEADRAEAKKTARSAPRGAQPEIIIRRTGLNKHGQPEFRDGFTFNGKRLNRGDTLGKAMEVLGPEHRKNAEGDYEWPELGIKVRSSWPSNVPYYPERKLDEPIVYVFIQINKVKEDTRPALKEFPVYLELDNVGVDARTKIADIRAMADRTDLRHAHRYIYCLIKSSKCHVGRLPASDGIKVHFSIDEEKDAQSQIYWISLYFHG